MDENEKLENDANKVKQGKSQAQQTKSQMAEMGKDLAKKAVQKAAKNGVKNQVIGQALTSVFSALAPYIGIAILVILIIIIIIGIIGFLITIPGIMKDKLNAIATGISDWWQDLYKSAANVSIKDEDVVSLANYIADMGYDLIGFGFVTPKDEDHIYTFEALEKEGYVEEKIDDKVRMKDSSGNYFNEAFIYKDGHSYNGKTGELIDNTGTSQNSGNYTKHGIAYDGNGKIASPSGLKNVNSSILKKYAISNARNQFLRNEDDNNNVISWFHDVFVGENADPYDVWSKGLIYIYESEDFIANNKFGGKDGIKLFGSVELKNNGKTLKLKRSFNAAMEFDTEGWSSRYGLTQDFLISLHLATLSPELVETMVETFDTEVQVYLDEVNAAQAEVKMIDTASSVIGIPDGKDYSDPDVGLTMKDFTDGKVEGAGINIDDEGLDWDVWFFISNDEATRFYKLSDMDSPLTCTDGYDQGIPDFTMLQGIESDTHYLRNFAPTWQMQDDADRDKMYIFHGDNIYVKPAFYYNNDTDNLQNIMTSSEVIKNVKAALHYYTDHGFSYDDFCAKVPLEATGDTAVKSLLTQNYADDYDPINNTGSMVTYVTEYDSLNDTWPIAGRLSIDDSNGYLDEDAYDKIWEKLQEYSSIASEDYEYLKYHVGQNCIYERGIPYVIDEDNHKAYFSHINGGFCHCKFCTGFYNKYAALQEFVNHQTYESYYLSGDEGSYNYDPLIDAGEIEYYWYHKGSSDERLQAVSHLYEWEYDGKMYRISFYYDEDEDTYVDSPTYSNTKYPYGKLGLVVSEAWDEDQWQAWFKERAENDKCSDEVKKASDPTDVKMCSNCKRYVKYITWSMKKINDNNYKTYVPYIARVVNSWFRDTYFIIPAESTSDYAIKKAVNDFGYNKKQLAGENVPVVENSAAFLENTGELWTSYVKYAGNYATFLLDSNGNAFEDVQSISAFLDAKGVYDEDRYNIEKYIKKEYEYTDPDSKTTVKTYGLWIAETDPDLQNSDEKKVNELLKKYNIAVTKIAMNKNIKDINSEGVTTNDIIWNAYGNGAEATKWQEVTVDGDSPYYMRHVVNDYDGNDDSGQRGELKFYVGLTGVYNFVQVADAQRGMTNSKIKYLFKNKKYYKYDGTVERSYDIYNDWNDCKTIFGSEEAADKAIQNYYFENKDTSVVFARDFDDDGIADIASKKSATTDSISGKSIKVDDEKTQITSDPRNPSLIDNIDLNLESLSAFSILENTPSADAEYAYRDLKELFVELDYFDTEDLVEPPKDILEWILPDIGSAGWPYRMYDKSAEYGTLIHSADMYKDFDEIIQNLDTGISSGDPGNTTQTANANIIKNSEDDTLLMANAKKVSSRAESSNGVTQEDVDPADYGEDGFKTITTVNGVSYKDYKQNNSIAPSEFARSVYSTNADGTVNTRGSLACGPTSTAVVLSAYGVAGGTGTNNLAWKLFDLEGTGINGTNGGNIEPAMETMGVQATTYSTADSNIESIMDQALSDGKPMVVNVRAGSYSPGGHYIAVLGYDDQKNLVISNPCGTGLYGKTNGYTQGPVTLHEFVTQKIAVSGQSQTVTIPDETPTGFNKNASCTVQSFTGFEKGQPIVSPATAKILEIGTVTVNNETSEKYMSSFYTSDEDSLVEEGYATADKESNDKRTLVTEEQYENLKQAVEEKEADADSHIGKSYTTGYVKLEVVGADTVNKFKNSKDLGNYNPGIETFYEEYFNKANNKSICDSYTIYIEGIDLTGDLEDPSSSGLNSDLSNTILAGLFNANNTAGETFEVASGSEASVTDKDEPEDVNDIKINYYTPREAPKYYTMNAKTKIVQKEAKKEALPAIIKIKNNTGKGDNAEEIYVKAGTTLGVTGDANIKIIMKNKKNEIIENVEEYMEIENPFEYNSDNDTMYQKQVIGGEISASENGYRTEDEILYAVDNAKKYPWSSDMRSNIVEMMDGLMQLQAEYDIDPLVAISLFRGESSCGVAYEKWGEYRLDNHLHWSGCKCSYHSSHGNFACYDNYSDNVVDWGNYIRNRFNDGSGNIETWDDMANFRGMTIYENCNVDDGGHGISFYKDLVDALNNR